jgi:hypothetical protein
MSLRSDLELGVRLAVAGGRSALARLLLIASGISLGVGLLLSVVGIFPAEAAVERRAAARQFEVLEGNESPPPDHVLLDYAGTTFGERPIAITYLAPVGRPPTPPWLDAFPRPNEIVVSPDLAELLASPDGALVSRARSSTCSMSGGCSTRESSWRMRAPCPAISPPTRR